MPNATVALPDIVGFVLERADENDLDGIAQAMTSRRRILREKAAAEVTVGATVTLSGLRPKYYNGLSGVVKEISNGREKRIATVTLDKASTSTLATSSNRYSKLAGQDSYDLSDVPLTGCRVTGARS